MVLKSIRWRLQIWYGLLLVGVLGALILTVDHLERTRQRRDIDRDLRERVDALLRALRRGGPPDRGLEDGMRPPPPRFGPEGGRERDRGPLDLAPRDIALFEDEAGYYFVVYHREGFVIRRSSNAPTDLEMPEEEFDGVQIRERGEYREAYRFTPPGECVLTGRSIKADLRDLQKWRLYLIGAGSGVLVAGLIGGWWLASRAMRPIEAISNAAHHIAGGKLSERIDVADTETELGRLAGILNATFARLEAAFTQQARFTADAAHELRTPVTVLLTQTQTALARERSAPEYRQTLLACQRAAQRMRRLIESLMDLARIDAGQESMKQSVVDLAQLVRECIELVGPMAEQKNVTLQAELAELHCQGDSDRLSQVMINLLGNAIEYNRPGGHVRVSLREKDSNVVVTVADTGEGIPAEAMPRLFQRFYRADESRSGAAGHLGLGLAISKAIIEQHGGSIEVESQAGQGSIFTVRLPEPEANVS